MESEGAAQKHVNFTISMNKLRLSYATVYERGEVLPGIFHFHKSEAWRFPGNPHIHNLNKQREVKSLVTAANGKAPAMYR